MGGFGGRNKRGRGGEVVKEREEGEGYKGVNRDVFDPGRQMLRRSCSFLCTGPPELAGSLAQMALCSKPSTNEKIERQKRRGRDNEEGQEVWGQHDEM